MIDWLYSPKASGENLDHVLVFSKDRKEDLLQPVFQFENVTFRFESPLSKSISSVILFDYGVTPIGFNSCFTVLDNRNIPYYTEHISEPSNLFVPYSSVNNIQTVVDPDSQALFNKFFPNKYKKEWCSKFQKISQFQDNHNYQLIIDEYVEDTKPFYTPEILPYLDAFTRQQDWDNVKKILDSAGKSSPDFVCTFIRNYSEIIGQQEFDQFIQKSFIEEFQCDNRIP